MSAGDLMKDVDDLMYIYIYIYIDHLASIKYEGLYGSHYHQRSSDISCKIDHFLPICELMRSWSCIVPAIFIILLVVLPI